MVSRGLGGGGRLGWRRDGTGVFTEKQLIRLTYSLQFKDFENKSKGDSDFQCELLFVLVDK